MRNILSDKRAFTLIELLVVLGIVGILSVLAVAAINGARAKARDTKRIADVKQIQNALEMYLGDMNSYPVAASPVILGDATHKTFSSANGFAAVSAGTNYMGLVPVNQGPGGADYRYASADGATYTITFTLDGPSGALPAGSHAATPDGVR